MANDKNLQPKIDTEQAKRKKEEQSRTSRRRSRQFIGLALTLLIFVGAFSIVRMGITLVQNLTDNTELKQYYENQIETMVWFDILPFSDTSQADQAFLKQTIIWHIFRDQRDTLTRNEDDMLLIPTIEIDIYATRMFGSSFGFEGHSTFSEPTQGIEYIYDESKQAYAMPITSPNTLFMPTVVDIVRESGGVRRVVVGYVATQSDNEIVQSLDYEHPVRYMDFLFRRDGSEYHLYAIEKNTTHTVTTPLPQSTPTISIPALPDEDDESASLNEFLPESVIVPSDAQSGSEGESTESASGAEGESESGSSSAAA